MPSKLEISSLITILKEFILQNKKNPVPGIKDVLNSPYFFSLARRHGVLPVVIRETSSLEDKDIPEYWKIKTGKYMKELSKRNLFLFSELCRLTALLDKIKIQAIPYKGPVAALQLYGDLSLRPFDDLDLIVFDPELDKIKPALKKVGYEPLYRMSPYQEKMYCRSQYEYNFIRKDPFVHLELHWGLGRKNFLNKFDPSVLTDQIKMIQVGSRSFYGFKPETLLLILILHGSKHLWERLGWLVDIALLLKRYPSLDWETIWLQARQWGMKRMVSSSLFLVSDLFEIDLPLAAAKEVESDPSVIRLGNNLKEQILKDPKKLSTLLKGGKFHFQLRDSAWEAFCYCRVLFFQPGVADWMRWPLPKGLYFLYPLLRPFRLWKQYRT